MLITKIEAPATGKVNKPVSFIATATLPDSCWSVGSAYTEIKRVNDSQREVVIVAKRKAKLPHEECQLQLKQRPISLEFTPYEAGDYLIRSSTGASSVVSVTR